MHGCSFLPPDILDCWPLCHGLSCDTCVSENVFPTIILSPDFLVNFVMKMAKIEFFLNYYKADGPPEAKLKSLPDQTVGSDYVWGGCWFPVFWILPACDE